jgi:hypothetical protein
VTFDPSWFITPGGLIPHLPGRAVYNLDHRNNDQRTVDFDDAFQAVAIDCLPDDCKTPESHRFAVLGDTTVPDDVLDIGDVNAPFFHSYLGVMPDLDISLIPKLFDSLMNPSVFARVEHGVYLSHPVSLQL